MKRDARKHISNNKEKCEEILQIADDCIMASLGHSKTGINLFEAQIIPSLFFNSESWIGINKTHIN